MITQEIITISIIIILAFVSPGPDFILLIKNSLSYGFKAGVLTGFGIGAGVLLHCAYCIAGIGLIISQSIFLFNIIKIIGAFYLLYIAYNIFKNSKKVSSIEIEKVSDKANKSTYGHFVEGFLCNALNPKFTIFLLSIFSQLILSNTSIEKQVFMGLLVCFWAVFLSFLFAFIINISFIKKSFGKAQYYIEKIMGGLLGLLGIKILADTIID